MPIFAALGAFLLKILGQSVVMMTFLIGLAIAAFIGFWLIGTDLGTWIFEQCLLLISKFLSVLELDGSVFDIAHHIKNLDPEILNLINYMKFGLGIKMLVTAVTTRFIMNLIPFVRI